MMVLNQRLVARSFPFPATVSMFGTCPIFRCFEGTTSRLRGFKVTWTPNWAGFSRFLPQFLYKKKRAAGCSVSAIAPAVGGRAGTSNHCCFDFLNPQWFLSEVH